MKPSLVLKDMINLKKGLMLNGIKGVVFSEKHLPANSAIWENSSRLWELSVFKEQQQRKLSRTSMKQELQPDGSGFSH